MPQFVIEREIPGLGDLTEAQIHDISMKSIGVLDGMGPQIRWLHSYIVEGRTFCLYEAPDEELIREHARLTGFPCNKITRVQGTLEPRMGHA